MRRSKTDQEGTAADVRYLKSGAAAAVLALRPAAPAPTARVFGGRTPQQLGRRFTAAAAAAGLHGRLTAHSGRVGLASELTARGASTTDVMLAGAWKTARMVAHYSAGATAELGAVAPLPVAPGETGRQADGRAGRRRGPPPATPPPANKKDALRCARSPLDGVGDARGTGPPDPAGLRHPRLSVWKWQGEKGPCGNVKRTPLSRRVPINAFSSVERGPSGSVGRP